MSHLHVQLSSSSSSSLLSARYSSKLCLSPCFSSKSIPFSLPLKPSSSAFSLTTRKPLSLKCRQSHFFDQQSFSARPSSGDSSYSQRGVGALPPKVFVDYSIYKGKAALTVSPRPPEFAPLNSGAFKVSREGYVLLQFAPAVGMRLYDWNRKQVFSLSVTEMGSLISLRARESCEFFHDPFVGKRDVGGKNGENLLLAWKHGENEKYAETIDEGKVRKVLKMEPLPDGSGHLLNLSVQNKLVNVEESLYIPVTKAELAVLTSIFNFITPCLLGWHIFANSIKPEDAGRTNNANTRYRRDYEWSR